MAAMPRASFFLPIFQIIIVSATLMFISHGQEQNPGVISIDCGAEGDSRDPYLKIDYVTDRGFINTGVNKPVSREVVYEDKIDHLKNLRAFPNGTRNCYNLTPQQGKGSTYLIKASFWYGNYDGKNQTPVFDLHIDVNYWTTVNTSDDSFIAQEIIYVSPRDDIHVCLVNTGLGIPFISALDLHLVDNSTYRTNSGACKIYHRDTGGEYSYFRHPDDEYDRIWDPRNFDGWVKIVNKTAVDLSTYNDPYKVPPAVLMTALERDDNMKVYRETSISSATQQWYFYIHFVEIQDLNQTQVREMEVYVVDKFVQTIRLQYGKPVTVVASVPVSNLYVVNFTVKASSLSNLPPILNAYEFMTCLDLPNHMTDEDDVVAVNGIKRTYAVTRDSWQGDPCSPRNFSWSGLDCTYDDTPRIISLNLSSSNLIGEVASSIMNLTALTSLDLSHNQLMGKIPDFFAQMPNLKILNLSGNNLSGSVPQALKKKQTAGILQANFDGNPYLCQSDWCSSKAITSSGKNGKVSTNLIIAISLSASVVILMSILAIFWRIKRRRQGGPHKKTLVLGVPKKQTVFKSSEISAITNNFGTVIGQGGFGKVYLGILDNGSKVAVKISSKYSMQGSMEFLAEAQLLMNIHHKNLVSLVGYCDEIDCMALIYELMSNGHLKQHLSENNENVLSWIQRLQIAVDAAQGIEYLHNGCKPPIIHRDLKTANILLNESMQAKIADFGLSKAFSADNDTHVTTRPAGTLGYLDPEFRGSGNLTKKSDVYSFGIILLELITGRPAVRWNSGNSHFICDWVAPLIERCDIQSIVDPRLNGQFNTNNAWRALEIAISCVVPSSSERPDMNNVSSDLKECLRLELEDGYNIDGARGTSYDIIPDELDIVPIPR